MNNYIKTFLFLVMCVCGYVTHAQVKTIAVKAQASVGGKIKLRWVINGDTLLSNTGNGNYIMNVWERYKNFGFIIERRRAGSSVIERVFTAKPDYNKLTEGETDPLLTKEERDACSAMKKTIYASKEDLYRNSETNVSSAYRISPEMEINNRHFGTMVASAITFKGACYAGLGIVDDNVEPNVTYEYTIKESNLPDNLGLYEVKVQIENVVLVTQNSNGKRALANQLRTASGQRIAAVLQAPPVPIANFSNKKVVLKWRWKMPNAVNAYQDIYYGYYIERASEPDLNTFVRLNSLPYVSSNSRSDSLVYVDSDTTKANTVLKNGKKYAYRLIGKTYFDDEVESQVISGTCEDKTDYFPEITKDTLFPTNIVELRWKIPAEAPSGKFKSFAIGRADNIVKNTIYQKVLTVDGKSLLDSTFRTATVLNNIHNETHTAYYVVIGIDKAGNEFESLPVLIQGVDTLAPAAPVNVKVIWDNINKVSTVTWNPNIESDVASYRVFRCLPGETPTVISDTLRNLSLTFKDTIKFENLKILYYVVAVDKLYNPSEFSLPALLVRPDVTPPIKPSFGMYKINTQGQIELAIYPSPSQDVASHILRRVKDSASVNVQTWMTPGKPSAYLDNDITKGGILQYIIEAVDSTGNKSRDTLLLNVPSGIVAKPQFTILNSSSSRIDPSITLQWDYSVVSDLNEVAQFVILKSDMSLDPTGKLGTWKNVSGKTRQISDYNVIYERSYKYGVKAIFKDGSSSGWVYTTLVMPTICGAVKYLEENGQIEAGSSVEKEACSSIRLLPGFHAKRNSVFHAVIKGK